MTQQRESTIPLPHPLYLIANLATYLKGIFVVVFVVIALSQDAEPLLAR